MGPFLLIDKSALQGLGFEEIKTLGNHYSVIICPVLISEIGGNLLGDTASTEENKKKVTILAAKSHGLDVHTISNYENMVIADLMEGKIPLAPQIPRSDGQSIKNKDGTFTHVYGESEEDKLIRRWESGEFSNDDMKEAENHRFVKNLDLEDLKKKLLERTPKKFDFKSMEELVQFVDFYYFHPKHQWTLIKYAAEDFGLPSSWIQKIRARWEHQGRPLFWNFAGYAFYCQRLSYIYILGLVNGFIQTSKKAKTAIDFQYLLYLPFVTCFFSADNFHKDFSKRFLRYDQVFVEFDELRNDLKNIKTYMSNLTPEERKQYSIDRGSYPPDISTSITNKIWKRFCRPWTPGSGDQLSVMTDEQKNKILARIKEIEENIRGQNGGEPHLLRVKYTD